MGAQIEVRDLKDELVAVAGLPIKAKTAWVRRITGIDSSKRDTYAFTGPGFLADGTVQVKLGTPRLYLVGGDDGGRYGAKHYRFVEMQPDGSLVPTPIQETDSKAGWALRVRDRVQAILDAHAAFVAALPAPPTTPVPAPTTTPADPPTASSVTPLDSGPTPDDGVRPVLVALVRRQGVGVIADPRRLVALLNDDCGGRFALEQRLLTMALSCGAVDAMRKGNSALPVTLLDAHLAERLVGHWGIYRTLAVWTVQTWREVI